MGIAWLVQHFWGANAPPVIPAGIILSIFCWERSRYLQKVAERRKADQMGFNYPRLRGERRDASDDDMERQGWL
jgi:hypothetical protein